MQKDWKYLDDTIVMADILEVIMTQKCNLTCDHCLRGKCGTEEISDETLDAIFSKIKIINSLQLGGGEVTTNPKLFTMLYNALTRNKVLLSNLSFTTNGLLCDDEVISSLKKIEAYIKECRKKHLPITCERAINICYSIDNYHLDDAYFKGYDLNQILENLVKYQYNFSKKSLVYRYESDIDVINIGRAKNLEDVSKVEPMQWKDYEFPVVDLGSVSIISGILCVATDGNIVPPNTPFDDEKLVSVGNLKTDKISDILGRLNSFPIPLSKLESYWEKQMQSMSASDEAHKEYFESGEADAMLAVEHLVDLKVKEMKAQDIFKKHPGGGIIIKNSDDEDDYEFSSFEDFKLPFEDVDEDVPE